MGSPSESSAQNARTYGDNPVELDSEFVLDLRADRYFPSEGSAQPSSEAAKKKPLPIAQRRTKSAEPEVHQVSYEHALRHLRRHNGSPESRVRPIGAQSDESNQTFTEHGSSNTHSSSTGPSARSRTQPANSTPIGTSVPEAEGMPGLIPEPTQGTRSDRSKRENVTPPAGTRRPAKGKRTSEFAARNRAAVKSRSLAEHKEAPEERPSIASAEQQALELLSQNLTADHRRSTVSIRLNEAEVEQLRMRATESGLSVSAYMRSCVLEAEQLRSQVKQALALMLVRTASNSSVQAASPHPPQLANLDSAHNSRGPLTGVSRVVRRSATFLLGRWFPSRRRN